MKRRLLAAAVLLFTCGGCVGYYRDPYYYDPYPYGPYYSPYAPTVYADPGWMWFAPSFYFGGGYYGGGSGGHGGYGGHGGHSHHGGPH